MLQFPNLFNIYVYFLQHSVAMFKRLLEAMARYTHHCHEKSEQHRLRTFSVSTLDIFTGRLKILQVLLHVWMFERYTRFQCNLIDFGCIF